jgi:deazaflavin-dependent oxidoreductase (nitroreductase family)
MATQVKENGSGITEHLKERLKRYRQLRLTVIGRKSGRPLSRPVWFVVEGDSLYLLPVQGSDTQWYQNVLKNPAIRVSARGVEGQFHTIPITDHQGVMSVVEKFRHKYGESDVKKYYSKFDVAVRAKID